MIWFVGIAIILLGYIALYLPKGFTHPIPFTLAYWVLMLPAKYFLIRALDMPFRSDVPRYVVDQGGMYLFWFLALTVVVHFFFSRVRTGFPMVDISPRVDFVWVALAIMVGLVVIYAETEGVGELRNSLKLRSFASRGFGAYAELILEFCIVVSIAQLMTRKSKWPIALFMLICAAYFILMSRAGLLIQIFSVLMAYLCMVRRIVPNKIAIFVLVVAMPLVLAQGVMRQYGGFSAKAASMVLQRVNGRDALRLAVSSFASRVDQLEAFGSFSVAVEHGQIPVDALEPLYIFSQVVPRSIWPDKPELFSVSATRVLAPRVQAIGTNMNFIGPAETMKIFGIVMGIIIGALFYGYIFAVIDRYYIFCKGRPGAFLFFAVILYTYFGGASQAGFFNSTALLQLIVYIALVIALFRVRVHRQVVSAAVPALGFS